MNTKKGLTPLNLDKPIININSYNQVNTPIPKK